MTKQEMAWVLKEAEAIGGIALDSTLVEGQSFMLVFRDVYHGGTFRVNSIEAWEERQADRRHREQYGSAYEAGS